MIGEILDTIAEDQPDQCLIAWIDKSGAPQCAVMGTPIMLSYLLKILDVGVTDCIKGQSAGVVDLNPASEKN